jgi:hypothetical protein
MLPCIRQVYNACFEVRQVYNACFEVVISFGLAGSGHTVTHVSLKVCVLVCADRNYSFLQSFARKEQSFKGARESCVRWTEVTAFLL